MTWIQAVVLGIVQGLTEFLPVSSSGHLVIAQNFFGFTSPPIMFDVVVHAGTLLAIVVYFYRWIIKLKLVYFRLVVLGTVPAIVVGLMLNNVIESLFNSLSVVGVGLLITSVLLFLSNTKFAKRENNKSIDSFRSIVIGLFQAIAIIPGISRSGSTVVGGMLFGLNKKEAFRFSFMLAIPAIIGALVLQIIGGGLYSEIGYLSIMIGFFTAAITGFGALKILDKVINASKLHYFGYYCAVLGFSLLYWY